MRNRGDVFGELAARILAGDIVIEGVYGIDPDRLHLSELEEGVVYGPPHEQHPAVKAFWAAIAGDEISIER